MEMPSMPGNTGALMRASPPICPVDSEEVGLLLQSGGHFVQRLLPPLPPPESSGAWRD